MALPGIVGKGGYPAARPKGGAADSLDDAKAAFRVAWERLLSRG